MLCCICPHCCELFGICPFPCGAAFPRGGAVSRRTFGSFGEFTASEFPPFAFTPPICPLPALPRFARLLLARPPLMSPLFALPLNALPLPMLPLFMYPFCGGRLFVFPFPRGVVALCCTASAEFIFFCGAVPLLLLCMPCGEVLPPLPFCVPRCEMLLPLPFCVPRCEILPPFCGGLTVV